MILYWTFLLALWSSFVVTLIKKWGALEWLQVNADRFGRFSGLVTALCSCDFCLTWWVSVLFSLVMLPFVGFEVLAAPFGACVLAMYLV